MTKASPSTNLRRPQPIRARRLLASPTASDLEAGARLLQKLHDVAARGQSEPPVE
jgi:hypothetical protein